MTNQESITICQFCYKPECTFEQDTAPAAVKDRVERGLLAMPNCPLFQLYYYNQHTQAAQIVANWSVDNAHAPRWLKNYVRQVVEREQIETRQ
jgi:hypothetical protein